MGKKGATNFHAHNVIGRNYIYTNVFFLLLSPPPPHPHLLKKQHSQDDTPWMFQILLGIQTGMYGEIYKGLHDWTVQVIAIMMFFQENDRGSRVYKCEN